MAKFNTGTKKAKAPDAVNLAGGAAYQKTPEVELASILLTSMVSDQYYRSADDTLARMRELLKVVDPEFSAKAAVYARQVAGMRSISHAVAGELAPAVAGKPWGSAFYAAVVARPDDMMEILAYRKGLLPEGKRPETHAIEKGFRRAFEKFDAYQLAKYRGEGKGVKLVDVVNLVHPKTKATVVVEKAALDKTVEGRNIVPATEPVSDSQVRMCAITALTLGILKNEETWESKMVKAGQAAQTDEEKGEMKAEVWADLLTRNKLGYMALVKNLRNILQSNRGDLIPTVCEQLVDERRITRSKVLPFRLIAAYKEIEAIGKTGDARLVLQALEDAIDKACANMPELKNSLVAIDNSGSMSSRVAGGNVACAELGAMFGLALGKRANADVIEFGSSARYVHYKLSDSPLRFGVQFRQNNRVGHGTSYEAIFAEANKAYDRIIIFTDEQSWKGDSIWGLDDYKSRFDCDPFIYSFDLAGYGTTQFKGPRAVQLSGFSEKAFAVMAQLETDPQAMVNTIRAVDFEEYASRKGGEKPVDTGTE